MRKRKGALPLSAEAIYPGIFWDQRRQDKARIYLLACEEQRD